MQPVLPSATLPPPTILDAQLLKVPAASHTAAALALPAIARATGQQLYAAIQPSDLSLPLATVPPILTPDQRMARILRGI